MKDLRKVEKTRLNKVARLAFDKTYKECNSFERTAILHECCIQGLVK